MLVAGLRRCTAPAYWYLHGFNIPAFVALAAGSVTYLLFLDPISYVPRTEAFKYLTATLPSVFVGGAVYFIASKVQHSLRRARPGADAASSDGLGDDGAEGLTPEGRPVVGAPAMTRLRP
jgi:hypothetical protein